MKKILRKKNIKWVVLLVMTVLYVVAYIYSYNAELKPDVRYYDKGTVVDNFGLQYELDAKMYTSDEFMKHFGLEKYEVDGLQYGYEKNFIVVEQKITRIGGTIAEEPNYFNNMNVYSKYWKVGYDIDLADRLQPEDYVEPEQLKVGETTIKYQIYSIASCNVYKELWDRSKEETAWFEFKDTDECPYVRRVRILN